MKISRSLTDLQNSLDEACRLGLPPNFDTRMNNQFDEIRKDYSLKPEPAFRSTARNLGIMISSQERSLPHATFHSHHSIVNEDPREAYISVLRGLTEVDHRVPEKSTMVVRRSRSQEAPIRQAGITIDEESRGRLKQVLAEASETLGRMQGASGVSTAVGEDMDPCEELRARLEASRGREAELLAQLTSAVATIEEAKLEEMEAVMVADRLREELDGMERRFKEFVDASMQKMGLHSEAVEREVHKSLRQTAEELRTTRAELAERLSECQLLREQVRTARADAERAEASERASQRDRNGHGQASEAAVAMAVVQREEAVSQATRTLQALDREKEQRRAEKALLEEEISDLRRRLAAAEAAEVATVEERVRLTADADNARREAARVTQAAAIERRREEAAIDRLGREAAARVARVVREAEERRGGLETALAEAEAVLEAQNAVIDKLRRELAGTLRAIDYWTERAREEAEEARGALEASEDRLRAWQGRLQEAQTLVEEQARLLEETRGRCVSLETGRAALDQEVVGLMTERARLMRAVDLLEGRLREVRSRTLDCLCGVFEPREPAEDVLGCLLASS